MIQTEAEYFLTFIKVMEEDHEHPLSPKHQKIFNVAKHMLTGENPTTDAAENRIYRVLLERVQENTSPLWLKLQRLRAIGNDLTPAVKTVRTSCAKTA